MERIGESYKLSTGKVIHPNRGIIGISEVENLKIYEGYDGSYTTMDDIYKGGFLNKHNIDLTNEELKEIALYMSEVWLKLANNIK